MSSSEAPIRPPPVPKKRGRRRSKLRPPVNTLCQADDPGDVLFATRKVVRFLQLTQRMKPTGDEPAMEDYREGQDWILGMIADALEYAGDMSERS